MHIVLIEDDEKLGRVLVTALGLRGHSAVWFCSEAMSLIFHLSTDVVIFDADYPDGAGMDVLARLRRTSATPVLLLVSSTDPTRNELIVEADDYLDKPVGAETLLEKIERTVHHAAIQANRVVTARDVVVNFETHTVWVGENTVALSSKEFKILAILARQAGCAVSRRSIEETVWGTTRVSGSRSLDVYVMMLRAKINRPNLIQTVRGFGYRFGDPSGGPRAKEPV